MSHCENTNYLLDIGLFQFFYFAFIRANIDEVSYSYIILRMNEIGSNFCHRQQYELALANVRMRNDKSFCIKNFVVEEKYVNVHCASFVAVARTCALEFRFYFKGFR